MGMRAARTIARPGPGASLVSQGLGATEPLKRRTEGVVGDGDAAAKALKPIPDSNMNMYICMKNRCTYIHIHICADVYVHIYVCITYLHIDTQVSGP